MTKILVIDDEENICFAFEQFLTDKGHTPFTSSNADDALKLAKKEAPQIVFLDIRLPGRSGLDILEDIVTLLPDVKVVVMTAHGTMDTAIEAMRKGAYEYITKPIDLDKIDILLGKMLREKDISTLSGKDEIENAATIESNTIIGNSQSIQALYKMIGLLTTNDVPVLIEGESGVGKELVARAIHSRSDRKESPFVGINCGAMPESLLESELFGHEKGAFTGADSTKTGKFEFAGEGTLFLDEIGDLAFPLQVKLLRVLQEKEIVRVGGLETIPVRARIITATNKHLADEMEKGLFRSDLYYRLQLITLKIPPLRERKEDIPELVEFFINKSNLELGKQIKGMETAAIEKILSHLWPGNVRELENVIKRAVILTQGDTIGAHRIEIVRTEEGGSLSRSEESDIRDITRKWFRERQGSDYLKDGVIHKNIIKIIEKTIIREALIETESNQVKASRILGMNRATLRKKIEEYNID